MMTIGYDSIMFAGYSLKIWRNEEDGNNGTLALETVGRAAPLP